MSATAQTLRPPSRTLMFLEGRALHEFGAFVGALPLLAVSPRRAMVTRCWCFPDLSRPMVRRDHYEASSEIAEYAVSGWRQGRNLGLREGVQRGDGRSGNRTQRRAWTQDKFDRLEPWRALCTAACKDDAGSRALRHHAGQSICGHSEVNQCLARLRDGERP